MSLNFHGDSADWLYPDSPPFGTESWHELHRLAERAGVSVEHLCTTVETATHFTHVGKAASLPSYNDDLEEVIRFLAEDNYGFELETKSEWHEWQHLRDKIGRFTNGGGGAPSAGMLSPRASRPPIIYYPRGTVPTAQEESQMLKELKGIHAFTEQLFAPTLQTRWRKTIEVMPLVAAKAAGLKLWSCTIRLALELLQVPVYRLCTMFHESLHALSPTTKEQYELAGGWEEAVIENTVDVYKDALLKHLGLSSNPDYTPHDFRERRMGHPYKPQVDALTQIEAALKISNRQSFYDHLMRTPATEIENEILKMSQNLSPRSKKHFDEVFDKQAEILRAFSAEDFLPEQQSEFKTQVMKRDEIIATILSARTREEVLRAQHVRDQWLEQHPDDWGIYEASETLEMRAEAHSIRNLLAEENLNLQKAMDSSEISTEENKDTSG